MSKLADDAVVGTILAHDGAGVEYERVIVFSDLLPEYRAALERGLDSAALMQLWIVTAAEVDYEVARRFQTFSAHQAPFTASVLSTEGEAEVVHESFNAG
jgi:hypothetical protein